MRNIYLGIYSERANNILTNLFNYYRNSSTGKMARNMRVGKIVVEPDGELVLQIDDKHHSYYSSIYYTYSGKDDILRGWVANIMKDLVRKSVFIFNEKSRTKIDPWSRTEQSTVSSLQGANANAPTVREIYALYEILKQRKNADGRYEKELIKTLRGEKRDPFLTELEVARREELKRIDEECTSKRAEIERIYHEENNAAYKKRNDSLTELEAERKRRIAELNDTMTFSNVA